MSEPNLLIHPHIDLFLYDLRAGLGQDEKDIDSNRKQFWRKIYGEGLGEEQLEKLKQAERDTADYLELLGSTKQAEKFEKPWNGFYYPLQLSDAYALQVDCSMELNSDKFSPQPISCLKKMREHIRSRINNEQGTIGESWLVWGKLAAENQNLVETARECYKLLPDANWETDLIGEGKLLGGTLYELWQPPTSWQKLSENSHILIYLFPPKEDITSEEFKKSIRELYPNLVRLFHYRNKIIFAYFNSRQIKKQLKSGSKLTGQPKLNSQSVEDTLSIITAQINAPKIDFNQLQNNLANTPRVLLNYANNLNYLNDQHHTIKVNISNYDKRLEKIKELGVKNDLEFFEKFSKFANEKYLTQVETDYANLSPGLTLLENNIAIVKSIIDIEQTKSDRNLNTTIAIAGFGLATSQIASAVILAEIPKNKDPLAYQTAAFFWSLVIGAITTWLFWSALRLFRR